MQTAIKFLFDLTLYTLLKICTVRPKKKKKKMKILRHCLICRKGPAYTCMIFFSGTM